MIVYILAALLVFGVLIAVHELGHFLAAKACGVRVNEFSIGMGPVLWEKQRGDTRYSLRAFPVGGFCAMEGEEEDSDDPAALNGQGFWKKLLIFAAGAAMNFLTGLVIIFFLYAGAQAFYTPTITGFADGCPLESADGLHTGDRIVSIDGERVYVFSDVSLLFSRNTTGVYDLTVERDGQSMTSPWSAARIPARTARSTPASASTSASRRPTGACVCATRGTTPWTSSASSASACKCLSRVRRG